MAPNVKIMILLCLHTSISMQLPTNHNAHTLIIIIISSPLLAFLPVEKEVSQVVFPPSLFCLSFSHSHHLKKTTTTTTTTCNNKNIRNSLFIKTLSLPIINDIEMNKCHQERLYYLTKTQAKTKLTKHGQTFKFQDSHFISFSRSQATLYKQRKPFLNTNVGKDLPVIHNCLLQNYVKVKLFDST